MVELLVEVLAVVEASGGSDIESSMGSESKVVLIDGGSVGGVDGVWSEREEERGSESANELE